MYFVMYCVMYNVMYYYTPLEELLLVQVLLHSQEQVKAPSNPEDKT